mgnify:CR=1 FL=1
MEVDATQSGAAGILACSGASSHACAVTHAVDLTRLSVLEMQDAGFGVGCSCEQAVSPVVSMANNFYTRYFLCYSGYVSIPFLSGANGGLGELLGAGKVARQGKLPPNGER